ncbi:hypothetical protein ALC60_04153 [Trachymyrmex zeteki]|uniref:Uncharacterized protein n=1 Tax=Mycetomoellerius zeteki TaxID=64791 RepID=A0A151X9F1_9HYME|nr:hypothetical protein ALC60_04153 [Trachymyrmex zeteki]
MVTSDLIPPVDFQPCCGTRYFSEQRGTEVSKRLVISTEREIWYGPWRRPNLTVDRTGWVTIEPYGAMEPCRREYLSEKPACLRWDRSYEAYLMFRRSRPTRIYPDYYVISTKSSYDL